MWKSVEIGTYSNNVLINLNKSSGNLSCGKTHNRPGQSSQVRKVQIDKRNPFFRIKAEKSGSIVITGCLD